MHEWGVMISHLFNKCFHIHVFILLFHRKEISVQGCREVVGQLRRMFHENGLVMTMFLVYYMFFNFEALLCISYTTHILFWYGCYILCMDDIFYIYNWMTHFCTLISYVFHAHIFYLHCWKKCMFKSFK